ncbi:HNH endonuclease signature motif containing protein [Microbacterium sp. MYb64]|uniref:HNH endonuclease signature motif containing protein n=1 Tax=Microbacterium sp. MYb64 TaxID=1848691 RepID=UPI000CFB025A|nr:HNH endonuclease signature motif containing protein [Microbacterium sp. MYb64]PRB04318.1 HNH endonuclease [Microbacterium sp. MYb64]
MASTTREALEQVEHLLRQVCASREMAGQFDGVTDGDAIRILQTLGRMQRLLDGAITTATVHAVQRDAGAASTTITTAAGCADVTELLRRALRVDMGAARRYVRAADAVGRDFLHSSGEHGAARYEALGQVLRDGEISTSGLLAAIGPVQRSGNRITADARDAVDEILATMARGLDLPDEAGRPGPAPSTDELANHAQALMLALDPDGAEPDDRKAERNRGFTIGRLRDGVRPVRGGLLPEVAGALERLFDAFNNPAATDAPNLTGRLGETGGDVLDALGSEGTATHEAQSTVRFVEDDPDPLEPEFAGGPNAPIDSRTRAQRNHDNLAAILNVAAGHSAVPALGGAAPTLVVSVRAEDYANGTGRAFVEGIDVPLSVAQHTACAGGVQRVLFDEQGQIVSIGTTARIFNATQRRAILLRDRECLIPGCHVPATWCEIHHVREHAEGGPTHTGNGVALCWHHHRTLDASGWQIRMRHGVPEIRGPAWWDGTRTWHRPRARGGAPGAVRRLLTMTLTPPG